MLLSGISAASEFFVVLGFIYMFTAWGLWAGKKWAWWATTVFLVPLWFLISTAMGMIPGLIALLIYYYLLKPHVRGFFGVKLKSLFKKA